MFTGIVEHVGSVLAVRATPTGKRLRIDLGPLHSGLVYGASIAVDGVCLTATASGGTWAEFDAVPETLSRSTLGTLRPNDPVNLERALSAASRLDGHFVQGHVDCTATLLQIDLTGREVRLDYELDEPAMAVYLSPKGSIAISGVSLTLADLDDTQFTVALIPTTLAKTTLNNRHIGDKVNIETDMLAKIVVSYLKRVQEPAGSAGSGAITFDQLREGGWL